ncbi:MAG: phosphoribosyl-AMP cyclohydrolase [Verrucomicrobiota bacterium]
MAASPEIETGRKLEPAFAKSEILPAVAQDAASGEILMLGYMDREALRRTLESGKATYFSRSRQKYWVKGETSGHYQHIEEVRVDCDQDAIVLRVRQDGAACHVGYRSCFYRRVVPGTADQLELIDQDKVFDPDAVYGSNGQP